MDSPIMALVTAFIAVAIMIAIGVSILSGVGEGFKCSSMAGFNGTQGNAASEASAANYPDGTWAGTCWDVQQQSRAGIDLMVVILIVIAAVAILVVVRML